LPEDSPLSERGWAVYSAIPGEFYFATFLGIAPGSQRSAADLTFVELSFAAVVPGWAWTSACPYH